VFICSDEFDFEILIHQVFVDFFSPIPPEQKDGTKKKIRVGEKPFIYCLLNPCF